MNCDIIYSIFQYLDPFDIINCSLVCKLFNKVSHSEQLWKPLFAQTFYYVIVNESFYQNYIKYSKLDNFLYKFENHPENVQSNNNYYKKPSYKMNDLFEKSYINFFNV